MRRELEAEKKAAAQGGNEGTPPPDSLKQEEEVASPYLAVSGVYFRCPMISEFFTFIIT